MLHIACLCTALHVPSQGDRNNKELCNLLTIMNCEVIVKFSHDVG